MASVLTQLIVCSLLVIAASTFGEQRLPKFLNPSPAACRGSHFLQSLGVCDKYLHRQPLVPAGEQEVGEQVEQETEPVEQEAEPAEQETEPAEQEAEPAEQEVEPEAGETEVGAEPEAESEFGPIMQTVEGHHGRRSLCEPYRFSCHSIKKCVAKSKVCDGVDDCGDGSDEFNCRFRPYRA